MTTPPDRRPDSIKITAEWNIEIPDRPPPVEPPVEPPVDPTGETTVTAPNGQWWKFKGTLQNGVYVNGDPWVSVLTGTTAEVLAIQTMPTGTGATARHGGMINPNFNTLVETMPMGATPNTTGHTHGYDGRVNHANTWIYSDAYNAHAIFPIVLHPGDSLVSAVSNSPDSPTVPAPNPVALEKMACVTVVDYIPEPDEFRPNYFGTAKIRKRLSDVDRALLPNLSDISPFHPKGGWFEGFHLDADSVYVGGDPVTNTIQMNKNTFRDLQYWILPFGADGTLMRPWQNQENYPRDFGQASGQLAMYVMCDFGDGDRDKFVMRILQAAIDAYAVVEGNGFVGTAPFAGGAGFCYGPCWFVRFAGLLFDDEGMKNSHLISTGRVDYYGVPIYKWGVLNRVYLSTDAHPQYLRVPGADYTAAGFPLYGDRPWNDIAGHIGANATPQDPDGVYDMFPYKGTAPNNLPNEAYPDILETTYEMWHDADGIEVDYMGTYMSMSHAMMGDTLASIAMGDETFWGEANPAYLAFALRYANDPQMWASWGIHRDYSDAFTPEKMYFRDVYACGGTGSGWMAQMWDLILVGGRP